MTAIGNAALAAYSSWATARELHSSRTRAQAAMAYAQFVAQFMNTTVVAVRTGLDVFGCASKQRIGMAGGKKRRSV